MDINRLALSQTELYLNPLSAAYGWMALVKLLNLSELKLSVLKLGILIPTS